MKEVDPRPPSVFSMTQDEREKVRELNQEELGGVGTVYKDSNQGV